MRTIETLRTRLENAKAAYTRECEAVDRALKGLVRVDPVHIKAAEKLQAEYPCAGPEPTELAAAEQPEAPVEATTKKGKK